MNHELKRKFNSNEVVVNNKSNFKSLLVKCQAVMDNIQFDELVLRGLGKATPRTVNLALQLNSNNYNTFEVKPKTYSVEILEDKYKKTIKGADKDNFDPDAIDSTSKIVNRIPAIEIIVRKNKLEIDKIRQFSKK